jgi:RHS repeat-associated protein
MRSCFRAQAVFGLILLLLVLWGLPGCGHHGGTECSPKACQDSDANCGILEDGCGATLDCGACTAPETCGGGGHANVCGVTLPPDPVTVAPKLDPTVAIDIGASTEFLYTGDHPIQTGVAVGTIEKRRVAVIRGSVEDRDGKPLSNVTVGFLGHPEFGHTSTRADGMYDLAANGGGLLTLTFEKPGFLTSQRAVQTPWRDYVWAPKVTMVPLDPNVTTVDLTSSSLQIARGSAVADEDGTRQARVVVKPGTQAGMLVTGQSQPLTALNIRATEYTVGKAGPTSMPAGLPPSSGYTYAVELSADEAIAAGATSVTFSKPLAMYVDNFLGFPVGSAVPTGYYERERGVWVASKNGRVIQVVGVADGKAAIDVDGDGTPDMSDALTKLGIDDQELEQIGAEFAAGRSLWRVEITHFTPWDSNWPYGLPEDAIPPPDQDAEKPEVTQPDEQCGSIIGCQDQTLGETLPVAGTPFTLNYRSDRMPGRKEAFALDVRLTGDHVPASLAVIHVSVAVAGRQLGATYAPVGNLRHTLIWDGKDAYGRTVLGSTLATVDVYYDYRMQYYPVYSDLVNSFARAEAIQPGGLITYRPAAYFTLKRTWKRRLGGWQAPALGFGGWTLDVHHALDPMSRKIYFGDGAKSETGNVITTFAGTGSQDDRHGIGDGGQATSAILAHPQHLAIGPDGSLYISDSTGYSRIRRVAPDGTITTVAGSRAINATDRSDIGDGGPATQALLNGARGIAVGPDGSLYIAEQIGCRIRRVRPDGIMTTFAGIGPTPFDPNRGDGGPASQAALQNPSDIALGPDGSLYINEFYGHRVRRIGTDGIITRFAGTGAEGYSGDGGPATEAKLAFPRALTVGADGSLYVADGINCRIRRVGLDGIIVTIAGTGNCGYSGDGGPAAATQIGVPSGLAFSPDGSLCFSDHSSAFSARVRCIYPNGIIATVVGDDVQWGSPPATGHGLPGDGGPAAAASLSEPSAVRFGPDGSLFIADYGQYAVRRVSPFSSPGNSRELFVFSTEGRHLKTLDATTGAERYLFGYDAHGYLASMTDRSGNTTTIERTNATTAIVAPTGQRTELSVDSDGWLTSLTDPEGSAWTMDYSPDGLLSHFTDPLRRIHTFTYDEVGRLTKDEDPAGGSTSLSRADQASGYAVTTSSALGRTHVYQVEALKTGGYRRTTVHASALKMTSVTGADGSLQTIAPDGTSELVKKGPDPRWGMQTPIIQSAVTKTPSGLTSSMTTTRSAALSEFGNPWSMTKVTDTVAVNGKNWLRSYDAATRTITSTSPLGRTSVVTLDEKGRAVKAEVPGLAPVTLSYDERGRPKTVAQGERQASFSYDAQGNLSSITDPLSRVTTLQSDAIGRLLRQTGPDGSTTQFRYDASSNIAGLTPPGRPEYGFEYTPVDLQSSFTPPSVGARDPATRYSYDKDRALTSIARPDGTLVTTSYDAAGRVSRIEHPKGSVMLGYSPTTGQLTSAQTAEESLAYAHDGRLLTGVAWSGAVTGKVEYAYDNNFRIVSTTVNGASAASRAYDDDGLLTGVGSLTMTRDPSNGLLTSTSVGTGAGAVTESYAYSAFGEVASYSAQVGGKALLDIQYTRDALGRIGQKVETIDGVITAYEYGYDAAGRLAEVKKDGAVVRSWTYDAAGNRTSATERGVTISATYDAQDRMLSYGTATYTYGNAGELQSRQQAGEAAPTTYAYDGFRNLIGAMLPNGAHLSYIIDALGRRVGKKVNGALTQGFLYENQLRPAARLGSTGKVDARFFYGLHANVPEYMVTADAATYRFLLDHLGSPRLIVNASTGAVVQRIDYDEWGQVLNDTSPGFQPFGFAGGLYDRDSGLVRFGARDYDPKTGRWTDRDPSLFRGGPNLYEYALGDSVNVFDHSGRTPAGAAVGAGVGGAIGSGLGYVLGGGTGAVVTIGTGGAGVVTIPAGAMGGAAIGVAAGGAIGAWIGDAISNWLNIFMTSRTGAKPKKCPTGTRPIDQTSWAPDHETIKRGVGAGPTDWTGITPDGNVITADPETGEAVDNGPASDYVPSGRPRGGR